MSPTLDKGVFVISLDTELAWGYNHLPIARHPSRQFAQERDAVDRLLCLMDKYDIKATWAIVGHLFLEKCQTVNGRKHPEIIPPDYSWLARDWFELDPFTDCQRSPFWYGPDIISSIVNCPVHQEIGCHTFSHIIVGDPECSRETFESELRACKELASAGNVELKSFVFPKNKVGHTEVLAQYGFATYRGPHPSWFDRFPRLLWRIAHKIDAFSPITPPVVFPEKCGGIWNIPASSYYVDREDLLGKTLPIWMRVWKARMGMRKAIKMKGIFHLWFHPYNLTTDMEGLFRGLEQIFVEVARLRSQGHLDNLTMGELGSALEPAIESGPLLSV